MKVYQEFVTQQDQVEMTTIDNPAHVLTESNYKVIWDTLCKLEDAVPGLGFICKSTKVDASLFPKLSDYPY